MITTQGGVALVNSSGSGIGSSNQVFSTDGGIKTIDELTDSDVGVITLSTTYFPTTNPTTLYSSDSCGMTNSATANRIYFIDTGGNTVGPDGISRNNWHLAYQSGGRYYNLACFNNRTSFNSKFGQVGSGFLNKVKNFYLDFGIFKWNNKYLVNTNTISANNWIVQECSSLQDAYNCLTNGTLQSKINELNTKLNNVGKHYFPNGTLITDQWLIDNLSSYLSSRYNTNVTAYIYKAHIIDVDEEARVITGAVYPAYGFSATEGGNKVLEVRRYTGTETNRCLLYRCHSLPRNFDTNGETVDGSDSYPETLTFKIVLDIPYTEDGKVGFPNVISGYTIEPVDYNEA